MTNATELPVLLVVEDDEGLQRQLKWAYEGYQVVCAGDRQSAVEAMRVHEPAVVTLDLGLPPDPDGVEEGFATRVRGVPRDQDCRELADERADRRGLDLARRTEVLAHASPPASRSSTSAVWSASVSSSRSPSRMPARLCDVNPMR